MVTFYAPGLLKGVEAMEGFLLRVHDGNNSKNI
jgi:hypothetical protein